MTKRQFAFLTGALVACVQAMAASFTPYVINGTQAGESELPWQAYVEVDFGNEYAGCGGTIIADSWVLTAAHCLMDNGSAVSASQVSVGVGASDLNSSALQVLSVNSVYPHSGFNSSTMENDIALLKLAGSVASPAQPIKLMSVSEQNDADLEFDLATSDNLLLSGWGYTQPDRTAASDQLMKVLLDGVSDSACAAAWGVSSESISANFLCANSSDSEGACNGDSGGPLVWQNKAHTADTDSGYRLAGIVSFGSSTQCADTQLPDVFTQVSSYLNWIEATMASASVSGSSSSGGGSVGGWGLVLLGFLSLWRRKQNGRIR
jgi:MYXO-CTERM domain-containing protein